MAQKKVILIVDWMSALQCNTVLNTHSGSLFFETECYSAGEDAHQLFRKKRLPLSLH